MAVNACPAPGFPHPRRPLGPPLASGRQHALPSPEDILDEDQGPVVPVRAIYTVRAHSMIILVSEANFA